MKLKNILLLPMLFMVTSCITKGPNGPIFNPETGGTSEEEKLEYYDKGTYGDALPEGLKDEVKIDFNNELGDQYLAINEERDLSEAYKDPNNIVKSFGCVSVGTGSNAFKIDFVPGKDNGFTINLNDTIQRQYLKISCAASYIKTFDTSENKELFVTKDAALQVKTVTPEYASKFVALEGKQDEANPDLGVKHDVTFDLKQPVNSFTLSTKLHGVTIFSISLYNK